MDNFLEVTGVHKYFGGVHALKGVDLKIRKGEVHCLAGENGSGKSTIIKIISGFYKADAGSVTIQGKTYENLDPSDAINAGIQVIYQDFSVFPNLTVMENLSLNTIVAEKRRFVSKKLFKSIANEAMNKINLNLDLDAKVEDLPVADKQLIAISRALLADAKMIIMDEPTTALTKREIQRLFDIVKSLKEQGVTILFVSHKLQEVFEISDRITIFRNGLNVLACDMKELDDDSFAYYMTGRKFEKLRMDREHATDSTALKVTGLSGEGFNDINFELKKGEILGLVGQLGSGKNELTQALFGLTPLQSGTVSIEGENIRVKNVTDAIAQGIALVPEDRLTEGLFLPKSIKTNITLLKLKSYINKFRLLNARKQTAESAKLVSELTVKTSDDDLPVNTLSGGNQQKVLLGKWLADKPRILILNGPTVGVDIGAKYDIHRLLIELTNEGVSVIVVSDDLGEVVQLCDRAIVISKGTVIDVIDRSSLSEELLDKAII